MLILEEIDFLVIGSGPSGQKGAIQASKSGRKVHVIEGWETGGSSLWTGTIPSKALRAAILDLTNFSEKSFYAEHYKLPKMTEISISDLNFRVNWVKNHLKETIARQLKKKWDRGCFWYCKIYGSSYSSCNIRWQNCEKIASKNNTACNRI